jgi:hypothetical protein
LDLSGKILAEGKGMDEVECQGEYLKGTYLLKLQIGETTKVFKVLKE